MNRRPPLRLLLYNFFLAAATDIDCQFSVKQAFSEKFSPVSASTSAPPPEKRRAGERFGGRTNVGKQYDRKLNQTAVDKIGLTPQNEIVKESRKINQSGGRIPKESRQADKRNRQKTNSFIWASLALFLTIPNRIIPMAAKIRSDGLISGSPAVLGFQEPTPL